MSANCSLPSLGRGKGMGLLFVGMFCGFFTLTSCEDILETDSDFVMYEDDNTLNHATDSVYSVLGIVNKLQMIADRTMLLGEIRADLVRTTDAATSDLKRLSAWDFSQDNKYNVVSDYYSVINHCNYFLHHVDTTLERRGYKIFEKEYAAVKAYRAWTYLELAKNYGDVPLVTKPLMTEIEAREAMNGPRTSMQEICNYFISDLTPYAYRKRPDWGRINDRISQLFFFPMRVLLGDLCLWAGRYQEAATWYHDYLTDRDDYVLLSSSSRVYWPDPTDFTYLRDAYISTSLAGTSSTAEVRSYLPMEMREFDGVISDLGNIYNSTEDNYYYYQVTPSPAMFSLSAEQIYCMEYKTATTTDTIYVPRSGFAKSYLVGDLRLYSNYTQRSLGGNNEFSEYSNDMQSIYKVASSEWIPTTRTTMIYLRYAEALNRAGYPQSAMVVLKYGMCEDNLVQYVDSVERKAAGQLIEFDPNIFLKADAIGVHSRGSGDSHCNAYYVLPMPEDSLATRQDTIDYQIPLVEDMIIDEMALEGAFEGYRLYDLMRVAKRRGDNAYLADPISQRYGDVDAALRAKLMDEQNWYLPLP